MLPQASVSEISEWSAVTAAPMGTHHPGTVTKTSKWKQQVMKQHRKDHPVLCSCKERIQDAQSAALGTSGCRSFKKVHLFPSEHVL